jgi:transcriptional regulator with XRE-family HTH domain
MRKPPKSFDKVELQRRLKKSRQAAGLTQRELARALDMDRDAYAKYESRPNSIIPAELAMRAGPLLSVPFEYLIAVDAVNEKLGITPKNGISNLTGTMLISVKGEVQAGVFREAVEWGPEEQQALAIPIGVPYSDKPLQGLKVVGPSMNLWYPEGSYVVILPTIHLSAGWVPSTGQHVIVQRANDWGELEFTVKEVAYEGDDLLLWPRSSDPAFQKAWRLSPPTTRDPDDHEEKIRITGLVVWSVRPGPGV